MKNEKIISSILVFITLSCPVLFAQQDDLKQVMERSINDNGNEISEALAKSLLTKFSAIEDIKEISKSGIESLKVSVATGEASEEKILILSLHKNDKEVMEAFRKGRTIVTAERKYFRLGVVDGDSRVEKNILYDLAMLTERAAPDVLDRLLEKVKNTDSIAFRVSLSRAIRFIENEALLKAILERFLEDKRDAVRGAPSGTNYFLRVCDVTAHEFYSKMNLNKDAKLILSDDDLKSVSLLYEKYRNEK